MVRTYHVTAYREGPTYPFETVHTKREAMALVAEWQAGLPDVTSIVVYGPRARTKGRGEIFRWTRPTRVTGEDTETTPSP